MKKVLFIDRDGTIALEPKNYQLDTLDKLVFYPAVFQYLGRIAKELDYELVMVTNQDGLGTDSFPEDTFWPTHDFMMTALKNEGISFSEVLIDKSLPADNAPTRKPKTGMLSAYLDNADYDLGSSYVIGDRLTDMELAANLGAKGILLQNDARMAAAIPEALANAIALKTTAHSNSRLFVGTLPPTKCTTHSSSICLASMATTIHWVPKRCASSLMSSGRRTAAELMETLSAPLSSKTPTSSTELMPPPTVKGMSMAYAT